ncbi:hypothetical protein AAFF_G00043210 [Aldrovandia affinis]|uniref:Uncharacterized protein n=1 Tax=Aldrovandia affinis TaxID=143900 RepID=A0AAD7WF17_9TELE|nr:hypothetical protein AAFF_G00043210 [Aldrovandia affinis]
MDNETKTLRRCMCGWEKVTTFRGLRIHQGRARCGGKGQQQPCTAVSSQTRGTQSQVENHSADGPIVAEGGQTAEEQGPMVESNPLGAHQGDALISPPSTEPNQRVERREPGRRNKIKLPKANEAEAWRKLDTDSSKVLQQSLHGSMEAKLNLLGEILYQECKDRFGTITTKQITAPRGKGRREKEIDQLVQRRRHL